jgi:hypothetical protein
MRVHLHWPLRLSSTGEPLTVETRTENVSSGGFYCISGDAFVPGEYLDSWMTIPTQGPAQGQTLLLHCRVQVTRIDALDPGGYGIACRIDSYSVVPC